jgi:hypothetical protein
MKKLTLLALLIIATITGFGQPLTKLYGFSQSQLPGMVPKGSSGNDAKTQVSIYFQWNPKSTVKPTGLWLNGKSQSFQLVSEKIPVVQVDKTFPSNPVKKVLVPANGLRTVVFSAIQTKTSATPAAAKKLVAGIAVVVEFEWKGKKYYRTLKKLTVLSPIANE